MRSIIQFLSADIPGGIYLLIFVLFIINLTFWFFRNSDLISKERLKKNVITANVVILLLYVALWFVLQPPKPQERVVVLPSKIESQFTLSPRAFYFPQIIEKASINNTPDRYLFHRWHWLYETLTSKKSGNYQNWLHAAKAMKARYLIESSFGKDGFRCTVTDLKKAKNIHLTKTTPPIFPPFYLLYKRNFIFSKKIFGRQICRIKRG